MEILKKAIVTESLSGASLKGTQHTGSNHYLQEQGIKPAVISGVSYGSIIAPFRALGLIDNPGDGGITDQMIQIKPEMVSDKSPNSKWNLMTAVFTGRNHIGDQNGLIRLLKKYYTEDMHRALAKGKTKVFVSCHMVKTFEMRHFLLNELDYQNAILAIQASASIPTYMPPVKIQAKSYKDNGRPCPYSSKKEFYYYDGGVTDHISNDFITSNFETSLHIDHYSRPDYLSMTDDEKSEYWYEPYKIKNLLSSVEYVIQSNIRNASLKNEKMTDDERIKKTAIGKGFEHVKIFATHRYMEEFYRFDEGLNRNMYEIGRLQAEKAFFYKNKIL